MTCRIEFKPRAVKDLRALSGELQRRIVEKIEALANDLAGDVKKLANHIPQYRLRVGDYRVPFEMEAEVVIVFRVLHRREAYR
jgi:mRNA interferase RelE/StbE